MGMKFLNLRSWKYFRRKNLYQIFDKIFFFWNTFQDQRLNLYWKWHKWLCEVNAKEEMNENLKTYLWKKKTDKNQNSKVDYKRKTRKLWKWIVIGGNFFIINKIIKWVTSQFLNVNFKSGPRTPALSKVEFIVTGAAITMFLVKLFLLSLINIVHSLESFGRSLKSNLEEEQCFSLGFYPND